MKTPSIREARICSAVVASLWWMFTVQEVRADQVEVTPPKIGVIKIQECLKCTTSVKYTVTNTGVPDNLTAEIGKITIKLVPNDITDIKNDVLRFASLNQGMAGACGSSLGEGEACSVTAVFDVRDGDPNDLRSFEDDKGNYTVDIFVPWETKDGNKVVGSGTAKSFDYSINVTDAPVPETPSWILMMLGFVAAGAGLRGRGRPAAA